MKLIGPLKRRISQSGGADSALVADERTVDSTVPVRRSGRSRTLYARDRLNVRDIAILGQFFTNAIESSS
jgi:hypothetical protein